MTVITASTGLIRHYTQLLGVIHRLIPCEAIALLRLDGDTLVPEALLGLSEETRNRHFALDDHPRLARFIAADRPLRLPPDCPLPDPYDGLIEGMPAILPVHDCLGIRLMVDDRIWGVLTLDALTPGAFAGIDAQQLAAVQEMTVGGIESARQIADAEAKAAYSSELVRILDHSDTPTHPIGNSASMQQLFDDIDTVASSDLTVLILGETGVGKELIAQRLHQRSGRRDRTLVHVNCAALPEQLAESELFGHRKGAFTGALQDRPGRFELADGGTLMLDEVGELPLQLQAKLLRVLQSGELQRPGEDRPRRVDVRIIAATNRDLGAEVAIGRFRADLYHRLAVFPLRVPPLRERGSDILALAGHFLEYHQRRLGTGNFRLTPAARQVLRDYHWPGNVRELEHTLSRATLRAAVRQQRGARWISVDSDDLALAIVPAADHFPLETAIDPDPITQPGVTLRAATERFQRRWIEQALQRHQGNIAAAAREAGMDRGNFHRLMRRLGAG